jgi:superfamily II DNA/RNA helicase
MDSFLELGLCEAVARGLSSLGFDSPTPVQRLAIPALLAGKDLYLESETGTGKTFAYLAPAFSELVARRAEGGPAILVAVPTQELAVQIGREAERLGAASGLELHTAVLIGGSPLERQEAKLKSRPLIVVGTLGRLADLVTLRRLKTDSLRCLILDEADRLLAPEMEESSLILLKAAPRTCLRALVSATLPARTRAKAAPFMRNPQSLAVEAERPVLAGDIEHWCFYCDGRKRLDFLRRFEAAVRPERCLVFMSQASRVEHATEVLTELGLPIVGIHSHLEKEARRTALERFTEGKLRYLLTSDLGARGLDIPGISHVVSLDLPEDETIYIHRAGRTGRAGSHGISVVLADSVELARASRLAVKEGFVFRCKFLEAAEILEPTPQEFFERAERAEGEKQKHRDAKAAAKSRERLPREPGRGPLRGSPERGPRTSPDAPEPKRRPAFWKDSPEGQGRKG